jgi:hypothetical protein
MDKENLCSIFWECSDVLYTAEGNDGTSWMDIQIKSS